MRDFNEYKRTEEALRETQSRLQLLVDTEPECVKLLDAEGSLLEMNPAGLRMVEADSFQQIERRCVYPLVVEEDRQAFKELTDKVFGGESGTLEFQIVGLKGGRRWLETYDSPLRDGSGKITALLGVTRDITEKKRAEAALFESEERLRTARLTEKLLRASELRYRRLFETANDGILILDAGSGKIVDANPYIMKTLGYTLEELIGKELWEIGVFRDIAAAMQAFDELKDDGFIRYDDLPLTTREGQVIEVEFVSNVYWVGEAKVIQCNIRDITERSLGKRVIEETNRKLNTTLEELSATTEQLWQASKLATMGELSASIAHELNNPLATVALRVENVMKLMDEDDPNRRSLEIVSKEVDRMANLIDNLLQFTRRSHRQVSTVDVRDELINSIEFVHYHLRTQKIEVVREFAGSLPTIQADRQQLRQLFLNLLTNAGDAMPGGGKLIVRVVAGVLKDAEAVVVEFTDSGEGIEAENLGKVWEPFFTTKPEGKGTGLGLAICRRFVEEPGGTIEIESKSGSGTTVRMMFLATTNE
jgi:PAS domain S-box-containing protein